MFIEVSLFDFIKIIPTINIKKIVKNGIQRKEEIRAGNRAKKVSWIKVE